MLWLPVVPRVVSAYAVQQLAVVDYSVANRVTHVVSDITMWAYSHDMPFVAVVAVSSLQWFDSIGGSLIAAVLWLVTHTP